MTEEMFDYLYSPVTRHEVYTYENFLKAVAKFPYLCGENNTGFSDLDACKREIAALSAHFVKETGGNDTWIEETQGIDIFRQGLSIV